MTTAEVRRPDAEQPPVSTWTPLSHRVFRFLWIAILVSNIGTWMHTVGAQWLLVTEPGAAHLVPLVQAASTLPIALLALPAGVWADSFDRRRMLLGVQVFSVSVAGALVVLTFLDVTPPLLVLGLTLALGVGTALTAPTYQSLIPELVPREEIPAASALGATSMNLARSIGPALAGLLIAGVGVTAVFVLNALSFVVFALVLLFWRRPAERRDREPFGAALRAGSRYVRHSPTLRRLLARVVLFAVPAVALWALLPLVAVRRLGLESGGYGLLLGALGVGAVGGSLVLPYVRARLGTNVLVATASLIFGAATAVLALTGSLALALAVLVPAGAAWVSLLVTLNALLQLYLPGWVRARGLGIHQVTLFGSQALGSVLWGAVASAYGLETALLGAAAAMVAGALTVPLWRLKDTSGLDRSPAEYWPTPDLVFQPHAERPVLVTVEYTVRPERHEEFVRAMVAVRRSRLRTGACRWALHRDGERPDRLIEEFEVPSWEEHLRQHSGRLTGSDREAEEKVQAIAEGAPDVRHLFPV